MIQRETERYWAIPMITRNALIPEYKQGDVYGQ